MKNNKTNFIGWCKGLPRWAGDGIAGVVRNTAMLKWTNLAHFVVFFIPISIAVAYAQHLVLGIGPQSFVEFLSNLGSLFSFRKAGLLATACFVGLTTTLATHVLIMDWAHMPEKLEKIKNRNTGRTQIGPPKYIDYLSSHAGTLLTSLGILGTFIGLALGTANFHGKDTDLTELMLSLSVAFWSSVFGISWALILKLSKGFFSRRFEQVHDVVSTLRELDKTTKDQTEEIRRAIHSAASFPSNRISRAVKVEVGHAMDKFCTNFKSQVDRIKEDLDTMHRHNLEAQRSQAELIKKAMHNASTTLETSIKEAAEIIRGANTDTATISFQAATEAKTAYREAAGLFEEQIALTHQLVNSMRATDTEYAKHAAKLGEAVARLSNYAEQFREASNTSAKWNESLKGLGKAASDIENMTGYIAKTVEQQNRALKKIAGERATNHPHGYDPNNLGHLAASINGVSRRIEAFLNQFGETDESGR